jgi:chromosome segregation ATPase
MSFSFLRRILGVKAANAADDFTAYVATLDPEAATEAEIQQIEEIVGEYAAELVKAKAALQREHNETAAVEKRIADGEAALTVLTPRVEAGDEQAANTAAKILALLDELQPEWERERQEELDQQALVDEIQHALDESTEKLRTARSTLQQAQREMQRAELSLERARDAEERQRKLAGLKTNSSGVGVALQAMQKKAEESRLQAETARIKAKQLAKVSGSGPSDVINEVLAAGKPSQGDVLQRLQARSASQGQATALLERMKSRTES